MSIKKVCPDCGSPLTYIDYTFGVDVDTLLPIRIEDGYYKCTNFKCMREWDPLTIEE